MEYFAGLDVSIEETHICIVDRDGVVIHEGKAKCAPKGTRCSAGARADDESERRDSPDGPDAVPGVDGTGATGAVQREPAALSGVESSSDSQDRSQCRAWSGASGAQGLLQAGASYIAEHHRVSLP